MNLVGKAGLRFSLTVLRTLSSQEWSELGITLSLGHASHRRAFQMIKGRVFFAKEQICLIHSD